MYVYSISFRVYIITIRHQFIWMHVSAPLPVAHLPCGLMASTPTVHVSACTGLTLVLYALTLLSPGAAEHGPSCILVWLGSHSLTLR